jgi:hypothetical protein
MSARIDFTVRSAAKSVSDLAARVASSAVVRRKGNHNWSSSGSITTHAEGLAQSWRCLAERTRSAAWSRRKAHPSHA